MEPYDRGVEQLEEMLGRERAQTITGRFRELSPDFEQEAVAVIFGRTWSRTGIDRKLRSLCSICIMAALGRTNGLKIVFELALRNGASRQEIVEVLLQVAIYAGYPAALDALVVLEEVLNSRAAAGLCGEREEAA